MPVEGGANLGDDTIDSQPLPSGPHGHPGDLPVEVRLLVC
ncbi:hypothetical protein MED15_05719 [Micromonospora noduli]|uniref:Uncharacterized protein n=1 Tax=Micromonospora noduli TaxID=709876 RepID=A0ABX9CWE7_9ACTN|nr:hypothetical protein MED15_05719 [Micromonospora noduli]RAO23759.1 hypothetical protein LUPAC07_00161 [Micromonospora noduli]RAO28517.1 hypothetical protein ONO86_05918 [Micromonospora noduli]